MTPGNGRTVGRSDGHIVQTHGGVVRIEDLIGHAGVETDPAQNGTYKIANVSSGVNASYKLNGEQKRWRGTAAEFPSGLPAGATDVQATRNASRIETFVTLNNATTSVFTPTGQGLS